MPHAVFISYSNEDKAVADAVCAALEVENIGCWIAPRDVQGGRPYSCQITQAIRETRVLLLILTVGQPIVRSTCCRKWNGLPIGRTNF